MLNKDETKTETTKTIDDRNNTETPLLEQHVM